MFYGYFSAKGKAEEEAQTCSWYQSPYIDGLQKNWMKSTTYSPLHKTKEDSGPGECGKMYAEVQEKWRSNLEVEKRQYQEKGILDHLSEV